LAKARPPTGGGEWSLVFGVGIVPEDIEYLGHLGVVDYTFKDITFPQSLPDWYFDPHAYGAHKDDLPI